jgi:hypothetical protein
MEPGRDRAGLRAGGSACAVDSGMIPATNDMLVSPLLTAHAH